MLRPPGIYGPEEQRHLPRVAVRHGPRPGAGAGAGRAGAWPPAPSHRVAPGGCVPRPALSSRGRPPCVPPAPRRQRGASCQRPLRHGLPEVWVAHPGPSTGSSCRKPSPEKARHRKYACPRRRGLSSDSSQPGPGDTGHSRRRSVPRAPQGRSRRASWRKRRLCRLEREGGASQELGRWRGGVPNSLGANVPVRQVAVPSPGADQ